MPDNPRRVTIKGFLHALIAISGWALFVYWWGCVLPRIIKRDAVIALVFIGITVFITVTITLLWVRYNIGIFRRKGPRKNLTLVTEARDTDFLGRKIEQPGPASLKTARLVVVSVEGEAKKYEVAKG